MEQRLAQLENQAEQLRDEVVALRAQFTDHQQLDSLKAENQLLRQAILRYALACGDVDLQMALVRSRHERNQTSMDSLKTATDEEEAASRALRELAQSLQIASQERNPGTNG
jgi:ribosomal protein S12 methylthiotransferase accessory factor YcaO